MVKKNVIKPYKPYISFIVVGRNDDYGYKFLERFQIFLNTLIYLCEKYKLNSELIIVEWNPPANTRKLYEELKIKKNCNFLKIRFIEVPKKIHDNLHNNKKIPLFEHIGKNTGIRRARGKFILITNPDIIFSEEMIKLFSKKKLDNNGFYRADRFDVDLDIPDNLKDNDLIKFCEKKWMSCWSVKWGRYLRGMSAIKDVKRITGRTFAKVFKKYFYLKYHGGCPGDFMLISKCGWQKFFGFPELKVHGGIDGYGCILAVASGYKFIYLKEKIYHQAHERPIEDRPLYNMKEYIADARKMLIDKKIIKYNKNDWGLNNFKLKEISF